ncbi:MAG: hypothetical protein GY754_33310 [bacterium]|nr:hypothetical protein [bacterium]
MKQLIGIILALGLIGCASKEAQINKIPVTMLTGTVIEKPWRKSYESWNAGGSLYYVLKVDNIELSSGQKSAGEGVILRKTESVPFETFKTLKGKKVKVWGVFDYGKPYKPKKGSIEQMPVGGINPVTGKKVYPVRGSGFKVIKFEEL